MDFQVIIRFESRGSDKYKTTFTTRWGTFAYERIPFGLINAGATFQRDMQIAFDDIIR
jgi:hypothetical protein